MSSLSMSKLKSYLPFTKTDNVNYRNSKSKRIYDKLAPEIGFQLSLDPGQISKDSNTKGIPELNIHLIGARHLPSSFGLKIVAGYVIKVKLFPGSLRFDSTIQTSSWPTFNEHFKFPMDSATKSSFKSKHRQIHSSQALPEKLFKGHFVVLTVFALLELPRGTTPSIAEKLQKFRRKSNILSSENVKQVIADNENENGNNDIMKLTTSETRRNIGSVTCFLDPKIFEEDLKTHLFSTKESWLPIKDITVTPSANSTLSVNSSLKGQLEIILQLCEPDPDEEEKITKNNLNSKPPQQDESTTSKRRWSFNDVKKKISGNNKKDKFKGLLLKVTTSKMRCSIKVKEDFESLEGKIYVKTVVLEHDILSNSWRSTQFVPSLSIRWNAEESTITIPIMNESSLDHIAIKISVATKNSLGKKIVLGTLELGPGLTDNKLEHWENMISNKGQPKAMWHSLE